MDRLAVICTYNPTDILLATVEGVKKYYPEFDIVVVDSGSSNQIILKRLEKLHANCIIEYTDNKNYELGAWSHAFTKYNAYKVYMFIQDTLIPTRRIDGLSPTAYIDNVIYSCHYSARLQDGGYLAELREIYKGTSCSFISELDADKIITGTAHTSFITNKDNVNTILQLEKAYVDKKIIKSKIHSWLSERTGGLMAERASNIRIDMSPFFNKKNGGRT